MQVYIYMGLCIKANLPVWEAGMVYLDMRRDKPMPIPVDLDAVRRFWRQVVIPQAKTLLTALATGVCPEPGPQWMSWECEYCDAVDACDYAGQMKKEAAARKRQAVAAAKPKQRGKGRKEARKAA